MEKEEKFLLSSLEDKAKKAFEKNIPVYSSFLDLHQQELLRAAQKSFKTKPTLFGGFEEAERRIAAFLPDYMEEPEESELSVLRAKVNGREKLNHRDYLGAMLGTGIKREQTGDIIVCDGFADIIVKSDVADFLSNNLIKAGRANISCEILPIKELTPPDFEPKETKTVSASSLRLDKLVAEGFKISRGDAAAFIEGGKVFVNRREITKPDFQLSEGDEITLRGKGKIKLNSVLGISKKGKLRVEIMVY